MATPAQAQIIGQELLDQGNAESQPVIPSEQAIQDTPTVTIGGGSLPTAEKTPVADEALKVKSLFFTMQEMTSIKAALAEYARIIGGESPDGLDILSKMTENEPKSAKKQRYFVYPQFHLTSLVYHSADDWSVRINDQKMTSKKPEGEQGLKILAIDRDKITVEWYPSDIKRVEEVWTVSPNNQIDVDLRRGVVMFTLKPNQTFSSYVMRVLEGKVMPMVIDLSPQTDEKSKPSLEPEQKDGQEGKESSGDMLEDLIGGGGTAKASSNRP